MNYKRIQHFASHSVTDWGERRRRQIDRPTTEVSELGVTEGEGNPIRHRCIGNRPLSLPLYYGKEM